MLQLIIYVLRFSVVVRQLSASVVDSAVKANLHVLQLAIYETVCIVASASHLGATGPAPGVCKLDYGAASVDVQSTRLADSTVALGEKLHAIEVFFNSLKERLIVGVHH